MLAHFVCLQSRDESQSRTTLFARGGPGRLWPGCRTCCTGPSRPQAFVLFDFRDDLLADMRRRGRYDPGRRRFGFVLAKSLLGFLFGFAFGFVFEAAAFFLFTLAPLGGIALGALRGIAH